MSEEDEWVEVGVIGVDAGLCWVGDPCYFVKYEEEQKPPQEIETWDKFLEKIFYYKEAEGDEIIGQIVTRDHVQFNYDKGHEGLGVCVSTGIGDGVYPVYAKIGEVTGCGKRVKEIRVVFIEDEPEE